ncbi:macrocin-O-methyltransferase TylF [Azospirillum brasilense]|nr:macrocin-O-methyltransferase TylF [Azospirillum brasilense]
MSFTPDLDPEFIDIYERCRGATMTTVERMFGLYKAVRYVVEAGIPGALAECGVWKGGSVMLMAETLRLLGCNDRPLYLFDTFDGLPLPGDLDIAFDGDAAMDLMLRTPKDAPDSIWCVAAEEEVRRNLLCTGYPESMIYFVPGRVEETIPDQAPERLALLRLDTDWYESTKHELEHLYPRLSSGGVLIIDDYGHWLGARKAVDEFLGRLPEKVLLNRLDYSGRIAVKRG